MFAHSDLLTIQAQQHRDQLIAEAENWRLLTAALRRRRTARIFARALRADSVIRSATGAEPATGHTPKAASATAKAASPCAACA
jgi:hypothetical protein